MADDIQRLLRLGASVKVAGGVRAVAAKAGLDPSNLSKFLRLGTGLSEAKQQELEAALGRPGGQTDPGRVVVLRPKRADDALGLALAWYLPNGAEVARASWSGLSWERMKKFLRVDLAPEIYAFADGTGTRLLVLLPAGPMLPRDLFGGLCPGLRWGGGEPERAVLDIDDLGPWAAGEVDTDAFDAAWPGRHYDPTAEELLATVRRLRLSWAEAIRRINYNV